MPCNRIPTNRAPVRAVTGDKYMMVRAGFVASMLAAGAALSGVAAVGFAAPAKADQYCEPRAMVSYCDGPVRADGSWRRCFYNTPTWGGGGGYISGGNCYDVPGTGQDPYPWAPQDHLTP
ncbi:Uncharacterised protein [Mycobacteroides abscessus subsp. massiliense]|nr:Uncharacterised protein [Mycobacteroides abscessus subsp. massiliense]